MDIPPDYTPDRNGYPGQVDIESDDSSVEDNDDDDYSYDNRGSMSFDQMFQVLVFFAKCTVSSFVLGTAMTCIVSLVK